MAITLTTSPQIVGRNEASTIRTYLYAWYDGQSGNSCTVHTRLTCICVGTTYTGTNKSYFMRVGGYDSGILQWTYAPLNANQEYTVAEASWSYDGGAQIYASAGFWSYVFGSADVGLGDAVYVPQFVSPPTGLSVSLRETYADGAKFRVSISSYGTPSGVSGRYIEAAICAQNSYGPTYKYNIAYNTTSSDITVTNASTRGTLTIRPNTQYYYGGYATNTASGGASWKIQGQFVTKAEAPIVQFVSATPNSATLSYSVGADGGYHGRYVQYSLDGGNTWRTGATITDSAAKTGTFVINGLLSGASYTIQTRTLTSVGATNGESVSFDTLVSETDNENRCYGSVNGLARETNAIYGEAEGTARRVIRLYGAAPDPSYFVGSIVHTSDWAVNMVTSSTLNVKLESTHSEIWENRNRFDRIKVESLPSSPRTYYLTMIYKDKTEANLGSGNESWLNEYGLFVRTLPTYLENQPTLDYIELKNRTIAKLIHQAFGHINYS